MPGEFFGSFRVHSELRYKETWFLSRQYEHLSHDLDSVGSGLKSLYSRAGTRLRYVPWMGAARSLSANMGARGLSANMEGSVQGGY